MRGSPSQPRAPFQELSALATPGFETFANTRLGECDEKSLAFFNHLLGYEVANVRYYV